MDPKLKQLLQQWNIPDEYQQKLEGGYEYYDWRYVFNGVNCPVACDRPPPVAYYVFGFVQFFS